MCLVCFWVGNETKKQLNHKLDLQEAGNREFWPLTDSNQSINYQNRLIVVASVWGLLSGRTRTPNLIIYWTFLFHLISIYIQTTFCFEKEAAMIKMDTLLVLYQQPRADLDIQYHPSSHSLQDKDISVWQSSMWWCWEMSHTIFEYGKFLHHISETAKKWKPVFSCWIWMMDGKKSHVSFSTGDDKLTSVGICCRCHMCPLSALSTQPSSSSDSPRKTEVTKMSAVSGW